MAKLVEKSKDQLLSALEDHLYLVSRSLAELATGDAAYMRQLVAQLRALVCRSSGLPGLLWRLCDEFAIDDTVSIRYPGKVNLSNPITEGLYYVGASVRADGCGPAAIPMKKISFKEHIQQHEALFIDGESISHEYLISRLANETGVAHEADGVSRSIAKLNAMFVGDVQSYFAVIDADARLILDIGERVIQATILHGYMRQRPTSVKPPETDLQNTRFAFTQDVPVISVQQNEGSILIVLDLSNVPKAGKLEQEIYFAPSTQGVISISAKVSRRRRIRVSTLGLPLRDFGFEFPLPNPLPESLGLCIAWKGIYTKAFAGGVQVAGPLGDL
jgi:hypothetical protein